MGVPNVIVNLANGSLGGSVATTDGVAGLVVNGSAVGDTFALNKRYQLSSTGGLDTLGVTAENNPLLYKEVCAFYEQAGEGAELHILVVAEATTLTDMCSSASTSPLSKLIEAASGRIRIVGVNKLAPEEYEPNLEKGVDGDAITAESAAQKCAETYAAKMMPFRVLLGVPNVDPTCDDLHQPAMSSNNRVAMVIASDDTENNTAAIGQVLGRAALLSPQYSLARVATGAIATSGQFTNGEDSVDMAGYADMLHDAGYIIYRHYPMKNGCFLNDDRTATPLTDDYAYLNLGRIIDKAMTIVYSTYIDSLQDSIQISSDGTIAKAVCVGFQSSIENAIASQMSGEISDFEAYVDPAQNILSTGRLDIVCKVTPLGTLKEINVSLGFENPALN